MTTFRRLIRLITAASILAGGLGAIDAAHASANVATTWKAKIFVVKGNKAICLGHVSSERRTIKLTESHFEMDNAWGTPFLTSNKLRLNPDGSGTIDAQTSFGYRETLKVASGTGPRPLTLILTVKEEKCVIEYRVVQ